MSPNYLFPLLLLQSMSPDKSGILTGQQCDYTQDTCKIRDLECVRAMDIAFPGIMGIFVS